MQKNNASKALRIGVIYTGKLLEEQLFRTAADVTVGKTHKNGVILPEGEKPLPKSYKLFVYDNKTSKHYLRFTPGVMKGKVSVEKKPTNLEELVGRREALKQKNEVLWPLEMGTTGNVTIGDSMLLFQIVKAPPAIAKPRLPSSMRGGWVRSIDWPFVTLYLVLLISEAILIGLAASAAELNPKAINADELLKDKFIQQALNIKPPEEEPQEEEATGEGEEEGGAAKAEDNSQAKQDTGPKEPTNERDRQIQKATAKLNDAAQRAEKLLALAMGDKSSVAFSAIVNSTASGSANLVIDVAADDGSASGLSAANLKNVTKIESGVGKDAGRRVNVAAIGGDVRQMGSTGTAQGGKLGDVSAGKAPRKKATIKMAAVESQGGTGYLSTDVIMKAIKQQAVPKVRKCYDVLLAQEDISGTIMVLITIDPNGSVGQVKIDTDKTTISNAMLRNCVQLAVKRMELGAKPEGGSITFGYPFFLTAN